MILIIKTLTIDPWGSDKELATIHVKDGRVS